MLPLHISRRRAFAAVLAALVVAAGLVAAVAPARARIWNVRRDGSGDYTNPQPAVDAAASGDTLDLGPGQFDGNVVVTAKVLLIRGAGRDLTEIVGAGHGHVIRLHGLQNFTVIQDLAVSGGHADVIGDPIGGTYGGGVFSDDAPVTLRRVRIHDCYAFSFGGGLYVRSEPIDPGNPLHAPGRGRLAPRAGLAPPDPRGQGGIVVEDCLIENCIAGSEGGGFHAEYAYFQMSRCVVRNNFAPMGGGGRLFNAVVSVDHCVIAGNEADFDGGALSVQQDLSFQGTSMLFTANTIAANKAARAGSGVIIPRGTTIEFVANVFALQTGAGAEAINCTGTESEYHGRCNHFFGNGNPALVGCSFLPDDTQGDPLFCSAPAGDFRLCSASPLLTGDCAPRGALGIGCTGASCATPTVPVTWSAIKSLYR